jgi:hypothetical protein
LAVYIIVSMMHGHANYPMEMAYFALNVLVYENCGVGGAAICPGYIKVIRFLEPFF